MIMQSGGISLVVSGEIPRFKSIKINALKSELIPAAPPNTCFMQSHENSKTLYRRQSVRGFLFQGVLSSITTTHRKRGILGGIDDFQEIDTPNEIQPHRHHN